MVGDGLLRTRSTRRDLLPGGGEREKERLGNRVSICRLIVTLRIRIPMTTKKEQRAKEYTKQVRIRKDLHERLLRESEKQERSLYYLLNKAILDHYDIA